MKLGLLLLFCSSAACTGCTSLALERHTLSQAATPTDIRYQEVLENLAMIARDPAALPAYSSIFAGTAQITDTSQFASTTSVGPGATSAQIASPQFTRAVVGNWTLDPINTPEKLEAIRDACRWVIYGQEVACRETPGLLASPAQAPYPGRHFGVADRLASLPNGWVRVGSRGEVPLGARYKAHCGDTWVWVMPGDTRALAEFNLILQDIARVDINSMTLQFVRPAPSDFTFPTKSIPHTPCTTTPFFEAPPGVIAEVSVDPCGKLMPDIPYYRWRVENVGSDAALRSQVNAAGFH
jgi:hypothetical protein